VATTKKTASKRRKTGRKSAEAERVSDSTNAALAAASARSKAQRKPPSGPASPPGFNVEVLIRDGEFDPTVLKFVRAVCKAGGFKDTKDVVLAMMRMAMDNARSMGPRYFGPQLKRYLK
jgi:hypothetical protein